MKHLILMAGHEVFALSKAATRIRIVEGTAWVSTGGRDEVLLAGDQFNRRAHRDKVLVSSARNKGTLLIEVMGDVPASA
jgi:hypothetical protein